MTALSYTRSWARAASSTCNVGSIIAPSAGFLRQPILQRAKHPFRTPARLRRIGRNMLDPKPVERASDLRELAPVNSLARLRRVEIMAAAIGIEEREAEGRKKSGPPAAPPSTTPEPKAQKNFTDPESRIMKSKDGFVQAYNAQIVVDSAAQIIVAQDVTQSGADSGQL